MPTIYSTLEYCDMLKVFYESGRSTLKASRKYIQQFPERKQPSRATFSNIEKKLRETGSFHTVNVLAAFSNDPHASVRSVAKEMDISHTSVHRILKKNDLHPYKLHYVQGLKPSDPDRRLQYISKMICLHDHDKNILKKILWTDESCFNNNGIVNRHNSHYWNGANPFWTRESNAQVRWSTNVWCGIISGYLIGPYFYAGILTGERYLDFLTNTLPILLENIPLNVRENMWLQQDGAPPHNANIVRDYLNRHFQLRWMGTKGPLN
uniref:DUF4817 domain-containing protein n=1 Tax=Schizaphis graminum TaxID=13262 RepID=A0A2S2PUA8_SCHGA